MNEKLADKTLEMLTEACKAGRRVVLTSSFQSQSLVLLHMISVHHLPVKVLFINTGFHFPETIRYKNMLVKLMGIEVVDIWPEVSKSEQRDSRGRLLYISKPDLCCHYNKVMPLAAAMRGMDIWISGVRRDQTAHRKQMQVSEPGPHGVSRLHPMLDWTAADVAAYIRAYSLPGHPLDNGGMNSIGCMPCTVLQAAGEQGQRSGRWAGTGKTECGLHTVLRGEQCASS